MSRTKIRPGCVSVPKACEFAGVSRADYPRWVSDGLLARCPEGGCSGRHVQEIAALARVLTELTADDGRVAWRLVAKEVRNRLRPETKKLDLVYDPKRATAKLSETDSQLADAVRVDAFVRVVRLAEPAADALRAMDRWLGGVTSPVIRSGSSNIIRIPEVAHRTQ
jgi:hypothetical protein